MQTNTPKKAAQNLLRGLLSAESGLLAYQLAGGHAQHPRQGAQLDVRDKALAALYALHGVLVQIQTLDLQPLGQHTLRKVAGHRQAQLAHAPAAQIVSALWGAVFV